MKRALKILVVLVVLALVFPVVNLFAGTPSNALTGKTSEDPNLNVVLPILAAKCAMCHSQDAGLPFYASFPLASSLVKEDIAQGTAWIDLEKALLEPDGPVSEVALAKIEYAVSEKTMPPGRFLALHWDGALSDEESIAVRLWIQRARAARFGDVGVTLAYEDDAVKPLPLTVEVDEKKAALGDLLFHDVRLSKDDTISCASCHGLDKGGTDRARFSTGVDGQVGGINSPTVFNAGFSFAQFWDGRAGSLEEQADGPVNTPVEMGSNCEEVIAKLSKDPVLTARFEAVYPDGYRKEHFLDALATFERTLVTPGPFDAWLRGESDAISVEANLGYGRFQARGCATCHVGVNLGGLSYEKMGLANDYFAERGTESTDADLGRFAVTGDETDKHRFKVPTLRNVALTAPYFHDGSVKDLSEAVRTMARVQHGKDLSKDEVANIVAFLETLTGEFRGKRLE